MPKSKRKAKRTCDDFTVEVVIEIPQGSRNKFEWDEERRVIRLDRRIPSAVSYPAHYGFIPGTLASDGDPVDVLVFAEDPLYPGVWMTARPIGVGWVADSGVLEPKVLCVPQSDPGAASTRRLRDVPRLTLKEIEQFFDVYKILEPDRHTRFARWGSRREARTAIEQAQEAARTRRAPSRPPAPTADTDDRDVQRFVARLRELRKTVAVAESCTGGAIASAIAATDGAGECFRGGVVAYAEEIKHDVLGVATDGGVINAEAARQMAAGVRRLLDADVGLATTGVVGPEPEEDQPVGTVWIGVASGDGPVSAHRVDIEGDPERVRGRALHYALRAAATQISQPGGAPDPDTRRSSDERAKSEGQLLS